MKAKTEIPQRTKKRPERAPEYLTELVMIVIYIKFPSIFMSEIKTNQHALCNYLTVEIAASTTSVVTENIIGTSSVDTLNPFNRNRILEHLRTLTQEALMELRTLLAEKCNGRVSPIGRTGAENLPKENEDGVLANASALGTLEMLVATVVKESGIPHPKLKEYFQSPFIPRKRYLQIWFRALHYLKGVFPNDRPTPASQL
jgi:hypothetical protein